MVCKIKFYVHIDIKRLEFIAHLEHLWLGSNTFVYVPKLLAAGRSLSLALEGAIRMSGKK